MTVQLTPEMLADAVADLIRQRDQALAEAERWRGIANERRDGHHRGCQGMVEWLYRAFGWEWSPDIAATPIAAGAEIERISAAIRELRENADAASPRTAVAVTEGEA